MKETFERIYITNEEENPDKTGWYDTDLGRLYYSNALNGWADRSDERGRDEYPELWYKPISISEKRSIVEILRHHIPGQGSLYHDDYLNNIAVDIDAFISTLKQQIGEDTKETSETSMIQFILDIDQMTTNEFCSKHRVPFPTVLGGSESFLQIDAVKQRMFVEQAKKLKRDHSASTTVSKAGDETFGERRERIIKDCIGPNPNTINSKSEDHEK